MSILPIAASLSLSPADPTPAPRTCPHPDRTITCAPIDRAFFYPYNADGGFGLAAEDGTLSKTGDAYAAVGSLSHTERLNTMGGDQNGLAVEAGRTERGDGEVRVLISNYEIPPEDRNPPFPPIPLINGNLFTVPGTATFTLLTRRGVTYADNSGYDLTVKNIHGGQSGLVVNRYRVDGTHDLSLVDSSTTRSSVVHLSADLPAPAIELVVIKRAHGAAALGHRAGQREPPSGSVESGPSSGAPLVAAIGEDRR